MPISYLAALALLLQGDPGEDKEACHKALEAFHAAFRSPGEAERVIAVNTLAKHKCALSVGALAPLLESENPALRIAAAHALGGMDHPKAVESIVAALPTNESTKDVLEALIRALEKLDWESGAEPLNALLVKYHDKGLVDEMKSIVQALGSIGSASSVEPLLHLLEHAEMEAQGGRVGKVRSTANPKLKALEGPVRAALQSITGGSEPNYRKWKEWWQANRERLTESAILVYRCKLTGKRWEQKAGEAMACPNHEKPEKDGQLVKARIRSRA
jgi:HEAT repeat protein